MEDNTEAITITELQEVLNITPYTARMAITALGIKGSTPNHDRRRIEYPPGTVRKVREWLKENSPAS